MSVISQFFPSGESSGGGGNTGYVEAKILVVGGGGPGHCRYQCTIQPGSCPNGSCNCLCINYGAAGGVIYTDGALKPGETCPIQVGTGSTSTTTTSCTWCFPCACCFKVAFQDGGNGGASYFGGTNGYCAEGGKGCYELCPTCTCPNAGNFCSISGEKNIGTGGEKNFDAFKTGFESNGTVRVTNFASCTVGAGGGLYSQSSSISTCSGVIDSNFTPISNSGASPLCPTIGQCPYAYYSHHGFYHELLGPGNGQVVGGSKLGKATCKQCFNCSCGYCCEVLCPTYTDAIKNFGGLGNGTGSGGEIIASIGGCPGSVIVQYPNTYAATPAPARPGSTDCSPNTPGFYTYYYLTPGSITLP